MFAQPVGRNSLVLFCTALQLVFYGIQSTQTNQSQQEYQVPPDAEPVDDEDPKGHHQTEPSRAGIRINKTHQYQGQ